MNAKKIRYFLRIIKKNFKFKLINFGLINGYKPDITKTKINIGGGEWQRKEWENLDIIYNYKLENELLKPFKSDSIDLIYTSHCIEYIKFESASLLLKDVFRVPKKGGVFRIVVPDVDKLLYLYDANKHDKDFKFYSNGARTHYSLKESILELFGFNLNNKKFLDNSMHLSFYNISSLKLLLIAAGFNLFKVCAYGQSDVDEFKETTDKDPSGFDNPSNDNMSLYLEAIK